MTPGERFQNWIDGLAESWKNRLRGWMASWVGFGIEVFFDVLGKAAAPKLKPLIDSMEQTGKVPSELQPLLDELKTPTGEAGAMFANSAGSALIGGALGKIVDAIFLPLAYAINALTRNVIFAPPQLLSLWHRGVMTEEQVDTYLSYLGYNDADIGHWKLMSWFLPGPMDLVNWQAKEVFEPEMIERYGLDSEFAGLRHEDFRKVGVTEEQELNFWRAHWEHASWMQVIEMLRRGQLAEEDVWDWFRLVEIPPFWRDKLIAISYTVPTRVDVRRFWDMRTIDEARLREIYTHHGYHGKDLEDYVLWTKVYVAFPDLMTRYKNGWLTIEDVRSELVGLGMPEDRVEEMIQTKVKAVASETLAKQRDLTMSQIIKGVKKAVITRAEGAALLQDMGYDPYEAEYILAIEIPQDEVVTEVKIRELTKADILAGLKTGVIFRDEARVKLLGLRYTPADVEFLLKIYDAQVKPPVEPKLKEASKADIVLGVKRGLITEYEGYIMLLDLDFSPEAADFILMVKAEESPFSPMSYNEFKGLTDKWKLTAGLEASPMPEELKKTAAEVVRLTREVEALQRTIEEEKRGLVEEEVLPAPVTARLTELQVTLHRAEAELARVKTDYDRLVAEWKHTTT